MIPYEIYAIHIVNGVRDSFNGTFPVFNTKVIYVGGCIELTYREETHRHFRVKITGISEDLPGWFFVYANGVLILCVNGRYVVSVTPEMDEKRLESLSAPPTVDLG